MKKKTVLLILSIATFAHGNPLVNDDEGIHNIEITMVRKMDELKKLPSIKIYEDIVTIEKLDDDKIIETSDEHLEDPLIERINNFLNTRKIQIRLPNDGSTADLFGRALGKKNIDIQLNSLTHGASEARTKLKRMILPILLAFKLKALIVLPIVITLIGLVGIKGLGAGLAALLLAGAVALKALLTPPPSYPARVSYGIVKPEIYHEHWHRSQDEVNQPYRAWAPEYNLNSYPYHDLP
ncbi:hypothetical protein PV325_008361 [Microctonus aethiopoides]|uniref:Uncharacterized protein n=1 Tax=Microctonus aethiopoides TaxID=144406 RepID=A0AA39F8U0_9HYME|nr:hypothetical protein PV325_008361 [Microctonus aethiopoides]KAK0164956.1 hypothetical protein PV328_003519 [Microctonus aethiopoides]